MVTNIKGWKNLVKRSKSVEDLAEKPYTMFSMPAGHKLILVHTCLDELKEGRFLEDARADASEDQRYVIGFLPGSRVNSVGIAYLVQLVNTRDNNIRPILYGDPRAKQDLKVLGKVESIFPWVDSYSDALQRLESA